MVDNKGNRDYKGYQMPDYLNDTSVYYINQWKAWVNFDIKINNHPDRFYSFQLPDSEEVYEVDLLNSWMVILKHLGISGATGKGALAVFPEHLKKDEEHIKKTFQELRQLSAKRKHARAKWDKLKFAGEPRDVLVNKKAELIRMFGEYKTLEEVRETLVTDLGTAVSKRRVKEFFHKYEKEIQEEREKYDQKFDHIPLTQSKGRIEQYAYLYDTQRKKYEELNHPINRSKELRGILDDIRRELEGDRIVLDVNGKIDVDMTVNVNKSMKEVSSQIPILSFIVGIVSSKKGIDAMHMMNMLQTSIYSQYSGVRGILHEGEQQDLSLLPSSQVYDWLSMGQSRYGEEIPYKEVKVPEARKDEAKKQKEKLLELIKKKQNDLS